jgi:protein-S-isoprenylcysteine O-methyltransferase Ste14
MREDQTLRIALIVAVLAVFPLAIKFRIKSHTKEPLDRRQEGLVILATLRPLGLMLWVSVIAWMINPSWMAWSSLALPMALRWTGIAFLAASGGLMVWTFRHLGPNLTDTVVTRKTHTLVTHGPYRWVRNPFYDSAALLVVAFSLAMANWFVLLCGALVVTLLVVRTRKEEENLIARFGERYRTYMNQTGRFLPRVNASRRGD